MTALRKHADAIIVAVLAVLLVGGAYAGLLHEISTSQRQWCSVLVTLDDADHHAPPPTTQVGRNLFADFHQLRRQFGCGAP